MTALVPLGLGPSGSGAYFLLGLGGVAVLLPNPRRTIRPVVAGYAGRALLPMTPSDNDVVTFDLSVLLGAQTIDEIVGFVIEAADPASAAADTSPSQRVTVAAEIDLTGTMVSFRLGNFLSGAGPVNYRLGPIVKDSQGNVFDSFSIQPVLDRSDPGWLN